MGLDMYLKRKIYIGANYEHNMVKGSIKLTKGKNDTPIRVDLKKVTEITEQVGYWRKANQIHAWFVKNVQGGVDDCGEYDVSEDQLKQLLADCKRVKADNTLAESTLPTQPGFFFGGTEYDEYYMEEIEDTIKIIESVLSEKDGEYLGGDIYYRSSW